MGTPVWKAPAELPMGSLGSLELRDDDPGAPPLPRPGEERLGPLAVRGVDPLKDGRGWRITVQPLGPGLAVIRPMDLGDGRRTPELRITVPRTVPFGAPWVAVGGGKEDILPFVPFPWEWATLLLIPLAGAAWALRRQRARGSAKRRRRAARRAFLHHYPPRTSGRLDLDAAHATGREFLASHRGEEALGWGADALRAQGLEVWATWVLSLDAARFARTEPPFPPAADLLHALEGK
ncbi:hypothetical protein [Mesoterricola silvestris]|uniref:Uncharacterized protein n=1 Tax=Mesoterricola silvestris TaxID=2927979 RepID=A0AA48GUT7_9BACT|nr:hypothetical protein [Mesoterricola silvestris]BDU72211.1 hypothetical protein METEAL_13850 [Mesoterricola silvestris]